MGIEAQKIWLEEREDAHLHPRTPPTPTSPCEAISREHGETSQDSIYKSSYNNIPTLKLFLPRSHIAW